jgi:hypothetical protein
MITCWYRWNGKDGRWDFNHIQDGQHALAPVPVSTAQKKAWPSRTWAWAYAQLIDYVVLDEGLLQK